MAAVARTFFELLTRQAEARPSEVAGLVETDGQWRNLTWEDLERQVGELAMGLLALDVSPGDRVAIVAPASIEWVIADLAVMSVGAISAVILHRWPQQRWAELIAQTGCRLAFVNDVTGRQALAKERSKVPNLRHIVALKSVPEPNPDQVENMALLDLIGLRRKGRQVAGGRQAMWRARMREQEIQDLATLMYTGGTTDDIKIVAHTHDALMYEVSAVQRLELIDQSDVLLLGMPLSNAFARVFVGLWLRSGAKIAFADTIHDIFDKIPVVRPTVLAASARVYEALYGTVVRTGQEARGARSRMFSWAMSLARDHSRGVNLNQGHQRLQWAMAQRLVFERLGARLRRLFGGRLRRLICGGSALSDRIANFFSHTGIDIDVGYGLTETCGVTCFNISGRAKLGTVGPALPGSELRIAEDGEILIRGRGLMRSYWVEPPSALRITADGFLCTGDVGSLDIDGFLRVEGRKEDRIVMASGLVVSPMNVEMALRTNAFIGHVLVDGDGEQEIVALVSLDVETVRTWARANRLPYQNFASLARSPEVRRLIQSVIDDRNRRFVDEKKVQRFVVMEHSFAIGDELTANMRLRRQWVVEKYRTILQTLHSKPAAKGP